MKISFRQRSKAQALVEFALAATLIFMLVAAAVDLGLIFLARQALRAAVQEGATFGSYPVFERDGEGNVIAVKLDEAAIRQRVRMTAGEDGGPVFANLTDLNNNNTPDDVEPPDAEGKTVLDQHITIENLLDNDWDSSVPDEGLDGQPLECDPDHMRNSPDQCFIRISVQYDYRPIFPLAPALAETVPIRVSFTMAVRSTHLEVNQ
ncbi:MAG: pilus assembly protein [Chloroflexales bacterium]|nr:pilus assembly protein [Chloroflexales bacterium]